VCDLTFAERNDGLAYQDIVGYKHEASTQTKVSYPHHKGTRGGDGGIAPFNLILGVIWR